jgi:GNAT superfamily N-acetyltransferase
MKRVIADDGRAPDVLFRCYAARLEGRSREHFDRMTQGWELALLVIDGEIAGAAARRAGELHIGILPAWRGRWAARRFIREIIEWAEHSGRPVTTGVMAGNESGRRLVEGVGFVAIEKTDRGMRYAIPG